jgi:superfamily II DNA or RNA helicase
MKLAPGLYEQLLTRGLEAALEDPGWVEQLGEVSKDAAPELMARHGFTALLRAMRGIRGEQSLERQLALLNRVVEVLRQVAPEDVLEADQVLPRVLLSLLRSDQVGLGEGHLERPGIPLRHSELIVNGPRDRRVGLEIVRELPSADRVDLLMSFVKWSGFVELRGALARFAARGPLRVLTTTYMGASDVEALEGLRELGADIRVSYDDRRTRLHAKAWLFERQSGFSTAIIGSSNLSTAALRDGCEWNVRLSRTDNAALLAKFRTTFAQYWEDPSFEPYEAERFRQVVGTRRDRSRDALASVVRLSPLPHQEAVLEALEAERQAGHHRNLVVAATGTGKTVISALDYARQPGRPRLLFVAHRDRILDQSLATFRVALQDGNFGEKLTGQDRPILGRHVFASVQSLHEKRLRTLDPAAFEVVVVDEFHHAAAPTYRALLDHLKPRILLGLTATPERRDGQSILGDFDGRIAAESRLWDALDQELLVPFQYFGIHDGTDLSQIDFRAGRYDRASLERLYTADEHRARAVLRGLVDRVRSPRNMRALGFCVTRKHAAYMVDFFRQSGLPAEVVDGTTPRGLREQRVQALKQGELCALFTVDVFNEGVDIPTVDTVLFLRPTESPTIFLQQLGRGLRLHPDKSCLTVLDFVGNAHQSFRFDLRYRALLGGGTRAELREAVKEGFPRLPSGCSIQLEERAQAAVLANLKRTLSRWRALAEELEPGMRLRDFLDRAELSAEDLYRKNRSFSELRQAAGLLERAPSGPAVRALPRLLHVDDVERLSAWRALLAQDRPRPDDADPNQRLLFAGLGQQDRPVAELGDFLEELWAEAELREELRQLVEVLDDRRRRLTRSLPGMPLRVHARYSRAEVSAALDLRTAKGKLLGTQAGVYRCPQHRCDLFFVTLDKDEKDFTPTTLYEDYPISPRLFHWETQSRTRAESPTGRRYQDPPEGWRLLLFVRRAKRDERGETSPFLFLGPVGYVSHEGERPMRITWRLQHPAPADWFQDVKIAAG